MDTIEELQILRAELIREIDDKIGRVIEKLKAEQMTRQTVEPPRFDHTYESCYLLRMDTGIFKGKRPTAVIFPDGLRVDVPTWKKVFEEILKKCNQDDQKHQALMDLRGKLLGRNRVLLGSEDMKNIWNIYKKRRRRNSFQTGAV